MNYIACIIQILEIPKIIVYDNSLPMVTFRTQLPCIKNKLDATVIAESNIWGSLIHDFLDYYRVNDYMLIEGYISIIRNKSSNLLTIKLNINKFNLY